MLCFSTIDRVSFDAIEQWMEKVKLCNKYLLLNVNFINPKILNKIIIFCLIIYLVNEIG